MKYRLKLHVEYFDDVLNGRKPFEIRKNDRGYKVNDVLLLKEFNPETETYTGRVVWADVSYITDFKQQDDYVVMGLANVECINNGSNAPINTSVGDASPRSVRTEDYIVGITARED